MRKIMCFAMVTVILLSGCDNMNEAETVSTGKVTPDITSIQNENKALHEQLKQLQVQLQDAEKKNKDLQNIIDSNQNSQAHLTVKYPKIADFLSPQDYQKIIIIDSKGRKTINDPLILDSISSLIVLKNEISLGSGPQHDIEPLQYVLTTSKGDIKVNVVQQGIVTFDELYPGQYFEVDTSVYQFGKAFMNPPEYINEDPVVAKMVNSGLLKVEANDTYYVIHPGRIRSVAMSFVRAPKSKGTSSLEASNSTLKLTFYLYGEEIHLVLYKGKVKVNDSTSEQWFDVKDEDIKQIKAAITAS